MKTRIRFLQVFFAASLLTALTVQSWHGWADYREKARERHCEHKSHGKASLTHTHASLEHCWVCDFTFAPFASFNVSLEAPSPVLHYFAHTVPFYDRFVPGLALGPVPARGPPAVNV